MTSTFINPASVCTRRLLLALVALFLLSATGRAQDQPRPETVASDLGLALHRLAEYGPLDTPAKTEATYRKALEMIGAAGGGDSIPHSAAPR